MRSVDVRIIGEWIRGGLAWNITNEGRHDVYDVTCGSILGITVTYFTYRRYYPKLHSPVCDEPFPSRESSYNEGFGRLRNDEEAVVRGARNFDLEGSDGEDES